MISEAQTPDAPMSSLAQEVRRGLTSSPKTLPPHLLYDAQGSSIYEEITRLPEYYPTRTEHDILERDAPAIISRMRHDSADPLHIIELGAGTATKTQLILKALLAQQPRSVFMPIDVSASALRVASQRLSSLEGLQVRPVVGRYEDALGEHGALDELGPRRLVLFLGSSIGNLSHEQAIALLSLVRTRLTPGDGFLLGTDLIKPQEVLIPAYDDAAGVTARFNLNLLTRLNRELDANFELSAFSHQARWNPQTKAVEMHLVSRIAQRVTLNALELEISFAPGESIHTESSAKYDVPSVSSLLKLAGFTLEHTFTDEQDLFAVHLARV